MTPSDAIYSTGRENEYFLPFFIQQPGDLRESRVSTPILEYLPFNLLETRRMELGDNRTYEPKILFLGVSLLTYPDEMLFVAWPNYSSSI